jgi:hypothetical protein
MTVIVSKPAVNLREELASLKNQGGYSEQQFWFENLVTNGTMAADTDWTKGANWTIAAGVASKSTGGANSIQQLGVIVIGKLYVATFTVLNYSAGTFRTYMGGSGASAMSGRTANGTYTESKICDGATNFSVYGDAGAVGDVDDVALYDADPSDDAAWYPMPKGWVPKDVYEDGLLQREGAANDYTVVYDGFDYYVKPTVAPSATTQTCVIGVRA